jgi:hypothetical protein
VRRSGSRIEFRKEEVNVTIKKSLNVKSPVAGVYQWNYYKPLEKKQSLKKYYLIKQLKRERKREYSR